MGLIKTAKAQLYLRKVASACRLVKYARAIRQMDKLAGGPAQAQVNFYDRYTDFVKHAAGPRFDNVFGAHVVDDQVPDVDEDGWLPTPACYGNTEGMKTPMPTLPLTLPPGYQQPARNIAPKVQLAPMYRKQVTNTMKPLPGNLVQPKPQRISR